MQTKGQASSVVVGPPRSGVFAMRFACFAVPIAVSLATALVGCSPFRANPFHDSGEHIATLPDAVDESLAQLTIEDPNACSEDYDVDLSSPDSIATAGEVTYIDMSLEAAIHHALDNSQVLREAWRRSDRRAGFRHERLRSGDRVHGSALRRRGRVVGIRCHVCGAGILREKRPTVQQHVHRHRRIVPAGLGRRGV